MTQLGGCEQYHVVSAITLVAAVYTRRFLYTDVFTYKPNCSPHWERRAES